MCHIQWQPQTVMLGLNGIQSSVWIRGCWFLGSMFNHFRLKKTANSQTGMVIHTPYHPLSSLPECKRRKAWVWGQAGLHSKSQASLSYIIFPQKIFPQKTNKQKPAGLCACLPCCWGTMLFREGRTQSKMGSQPMFPQGRKWGPGIEAVVLNLLCTLTSLGTLTSQEKWSESLFLPGRKGMAEPKTGQNRVWLWVWKVPRGYKRGILWEI